MPLATPQVAPTPVDVRATTSLRDSDVDGNAVVADGRVLADRELRRLFDWWLSLDGELPRHAIRAGLAQWLVARVGAVDASSVLAVFDRYRRYLDAVATIDARLPLEQRLEQLHALRGEWLGAELAAAFFADEERDAALALERRRVAADAPLTRAERAERIATLDAALPEPERAAREAEADPWLAEAQSRELAADAASPAERHDARAALWGEAAATRLASLDVQRAAWDARLADYRRERDALLAATPPAARESALAGLRARRFAPHEARRVESLEAIAALPSG